jgi:hypothetical protein
MSSVGVGPGELVGEGLGVGVAWVEGGEDDPHPVSRMSITKLKMIRPTRIALRFGRRLVPAPGTYVLEK